MLTDARGKPQSKSAATIDDVGHHEGRVLRIIVAQWEDQPGGIRGIRFVGRIDLLPPPVNPEDAIAAIRVYGLVAVQPANVACRIGRQASGAKSPTMANSPACELRYARYRCDT